MKFIKSSYDPDTGHSYVIMQHLGKKFVGEAHLHPEDKDNASKYAGCEYAEIRAAIKALKYERKIAKNKADQALDFYKSCIGYADFDPESETAKVIKRQLNQRIKRVNEITDSINNLMGELDRRIQHRTIVTNTLKRNKEKSKEVK